ncbi:hypothetical protein [Pseudotabrizicola sp. L79]|uniref:hypothetical protein n=1 Tax=Pseudotabrizicola sp. L79 TaxID=3118402 RepID=UPI002F920A9A
MRWPLTLSVLIPLAAVAQSLDLTTSPASPPAESFVNTSDLATPNGTEVLVDLPNAFHWSRYQRGTLGDWTYVLYPDGSAKVMDGSDRPSVHVTLTCVKAVACQITGQSGQALTISATREAKPPVPAAPDAQGAAIYLARWILAGTGPVPPIPEPAPEPAADARDDALATASAPNSQPPAADNPSDGDAGEAGQPDPTATAERDDLPQPAPLAEDGTLEVADAAPDAQAVAEAKAEALANLTDPACPETEAFVPNECSQPAGPIAPAARPGAVPSAPASATLPVTPRPATEVAPSQPAPGLSGFDLACTVTGTTSLQDASSNPKSLRFAKPRVSLGCNTKLTDRLSLRFSLVGYGNASDQGSSDPDFTYAFTYRLNESLNLGYSNYGGQFSGANGNFLDALKDGDLRANYKLPVFTLPNGKSLPCTASLGLPNPVKDSLSLSCGYAVTDRFRIGGTIKLYAPGVQDTYQSDYSYTASYRISDDWVLSYSNYSNNRWPWNRGADPGPGFLGGNLSLTFKFSL